MIPFAKQHFRVIAAVLICAVGLFTLSIRLSPITLDEIPFTQIALMVVWCLLGTSLGLSWLRYFRGANKTQTDHSDEENPISIWGWVWRYSVSYSLSMLVTTVFYTIAYRQGISISPYFLFAGLVFWSFAASTLVFGVDRGQKFAGLLAFARRGA